MLRVNIGVGLSKIHLALMFFLTEDSHLATATRSPKIASLRGCVLDPMLRIVAKYLDNNAYSRVDLAFLFAPMCKL